MSDPAPDAHRDEYLAEATRNIAAGLCLNWGANWDEATRAEVIGHLLKVARELERLGWR